MSNNLYSTIDESHFGLGGDNLNVYLNPPYDTQPIDRNTPITTIGSWGIPIGAGGYGPRHARWAGESAPAGGQGIMNDGANTLPHQAIATGGMPGLTS